jgi:hypothetical protein
MHHQVAFKTGEYKQQVIFIGGLTDGLLATEYVASSLFDLNLYLLGEIVYSADTLSNHVCFMYIN